MEEGAVVNKKWVTMGELDKMERNNEIAEPIIYDMEKLKEYKKYGKKYNIYYGTNNIVRENKIGRYINGKI